ncbi:MAG: hypothetical protein HY794_16215 [Desulfarculus sp.]|nr:hypothetical protein [Desulfarculus sp.]
MTRAKRLSMAALAALLLLWGLGAAPALAADFVNYTDDPLGFACQVPGDWPPPRSKPPATLIFAGPQGTEQYYTTINAQLVHNPASNLEAQAQEFLGQIGNNPQYRLLARQTGSLAGQRGVRLLVEYQLPGSSQVFRQEQFVADRAPYYFWLAYTAPVDLFDKHQALMARAVSSLSFLPLRGAQAPAPAGPPPAPPGQPPQPASQTPAPLGQPPAPTGQAPPAGQEPQVYDLRMATGIGEQGPTGVSQVFAPETQRIYVWFRFRGLPAGSELRSEWFFSDHGQMKKLTETATKVQDPAIAWGQFNLSINPGSKFPAGQYRVDIYLGRQLQGSAFFQVR